MSTEVAPAQIDSERVKELTARESKRLDEATPGSKRMFERARNVLPGGVPSSYQVREPWPIYLERGEGAAVWDVDGRELWDFHNGFGSMPQGHAHPAIARAVEERIRLGTHFAAPPRTGSSSQRSSRGASGCRNGATPTPAPRRRWTRSESPAG